MGEFCRRPSVRYSSYLGLSDLLLIVECYCAGNSSERWFTHTRAKVHLALEIAKSWNVVEVEPEFLGFEEGSLRELEIGLDGSSRPWVLFATKLRSFPF